MMVQHGGPRLFHATEGSSHVLFLRREGRYWRTVGDYPSYDLEIHSTSASGLTAMWQAGELRELPPVERISALLLRAEVESATPGDVRNSLARYPAGVDGDFYVRGLFDLTRLMGPYRVATWIDALCREAKSAATRFAACSVAASHFPGRCDAVRQAQDAAKEVLGTAWRANGWQSCLTASRVAAADLSAGVTRLRGFPGFRTDPAQWRETLRVYASATDDGVRRAACAAAARSADTRDLPECKAR